MPVTTFNADQRFVGATLARYEHNGYDDSDFYAIVWDSNMNRPTVVQYDTTRFAGGGSATVDATDEVQQLARAWYAAKIAELNITDAYENALVPEIGDEVRSLTTRGKNVGVVGTLRWKGIDGFRSTRHFTYYRGGIDVGEEKLRYIAMDKIERIEARTVNEQQISDDAQRWSKTANWRSLAGLGRGLL